MVARILEIPSGWYGWRLVDDCEAFLDQLQAVPLFDLWAMLREMALFARPLDLARALDVNGVPDSGFSDGLIEVVPAIAERDTVDVVLWPVHRELHCLGVRAHYNELNRLGEERRFGEEVAGELSGSGYFPEHVAERGAERAHGGGSERDQIDVAILGVDRRINDVSDESTENVQLAELLARDICRRVCCSIRQD